MTSGAEGAGRDGGSTADVVDAWRPMAFGRRPARSVRNPLMEPLWPGQRVLVHVQANGGVMARSNAGPNASSIRIWDGAGTELAGHPDVRAVLLEAALVGEVVVDGYLLPLPPRDAALAGPPDADVPGVAATARHLFLGSRAGAGRRAQRSASSPNRVGVAAAGSTATAMTFVAIDLLVLDGEELIDVPLQERLRLLDGILVAGERVRLSPHVRLPAANWYRQWRALGFRDMAVKDANSRYHPGESSPDWSIAPIPTR